MDKNNKLYKDVSEYREREEIIAEIQSLYEEMFDYEKNDLDALTTDELKEYLDDLSNKQPVVDNIKDLLENSDIDFGGLEEMEMTELLELQERLESNGDN